jgi:hypothetical protein
MYQQLQCIPIAWSVMCAPAATRKCHVIRHEVEQAVRHHVIDSTHATRRHYVSACRECDVQRFLLEMLLTHTTHATHSGGKKAKGKGKARAKKNGSAMFTMTSGCDATSAVLAPLRMVKPGRYELCLTTHTVYY